MSITFTEPKRRPFNEYAPQARTICEDADPPVTFREALSVYRQLRFGSLVFRCKFDHHETGVRLREPQR